MIGKSGVSLLSLRKVQISRHRRDPPSLVLQPLQHLDLLLLGLPQLRQLGRRRRRCRGLGRLGRLGRRRRGGLGQRLLEVGDLLVEARQVGAIVQDLEGEGCPGISNSVTGGQTEQNPT